MNIVSFSTRPRCTEHQTSPSDCNVNVGGNERLLSVAGAIGLISLSAKREPLTQLFCSSASPMSSAGHSISLDARGCSSSMAADQPTGPNVSAVDPTSLGVASTDPTPLDVASTQLASLELASIEVDSAPADEGSPARVAPERKHRVAEVRVQEGVSQRSLARRLGIDLKALQVLERPESDLCLSQLLALQVALDVPLIDLLEDCSDLSRPIAERAKMVKVMKTAVALRETKSNARVERMVTMLCEQLVEVMPELAEVSGWPQFGSRRGTLALGKALWQPIDTSDLGLPN